MKYYNIRNLMRDYPDAHYYMVVGERSNGKTYSALEYALANYVKTGEQFAYVRRWGEDIRKKNVSQLFAAHESNGLVSKLTGGKWDRITFTGGKFYFSGLNEKEKVEFSEDACGFVFDLNSMEHYKSISFPRVTTVIFDEFLSRNGYLPNEFVLFTNTLSTIIRQRNNVKIIMLGNTVNKSCPYFGEMGITHIKEQKPGTVDVYRYGNSSLEVVLEYCEPTARYGGKKSDVYFAFDNPELQMITQGSWEIAVYPHKPCSFRPKDIVFIFFIEFESELIQGEVVSLNDSAFIFFHRKTGEIKYPDRDLVYTTKASEKWNYRMCLTKQTDNMSKKILQYFKENRCFYADNETGEVVRNYLIWSDSYNIRN